MGVKHHRLPPDGVHRRRLPSGKELARVLRRIAARQLAELLARCRTRMPRRVNLDHWEQTIANEVQPYLLDYLIDGLEDQQRRQRRSRKRKDVAPGRRGLLYRLANVATQAAQRFAATTIQTATDAVNGLIEQAREVADRVSDGLSWLVDSLRSWFRGKTGKDRVVVAAAREAQDAFHRGQVEAAKEVELTRKRWLVGAKPCKECRKLAGKVVGVDELFVQLPGPYGSVRNPPLHPRCQCSMELIA